MNSSGDIMADNDGDSAFGPRSGQKVLTVQAVMPRETDRNPDGS